MCTELMLHSLSVVRLVTCPDRHFAQTPPFQKGPEQNFAVVVDIDRDVVVVDGTVLLLCCRLQDKLEKQHLENLKVRQSLGETLNNLENHEIQLALAMQDLMVATSEIKKAAKIREQLNQLER